MSCYTPKRKTNNGIEDVKLPINSINGLEDRLATIGGRKLSMPIIRLANVLDTNNTMIIGPSNPLKFCVEIIDGSLQVGDSLQICVKQLFTYRKRNKRKYRLRCQWSVKVTKQDIGSRFLYVNVIESLSGISQRLYRTNDWGNSTLSPLYIRIRRSIFAGTNEVDAYFSNIVTVWKKYSLETGKILIK